MKIVHCLGWYLPESVGGTEIYVQGLCRELRACGVDVAIMAPRDGCEEASYLHDGVRVVRYPVPETRDQDQIEGRSPHAMFEVFQRQLRELRADVFHIHSQTTGCGAPHLAYARELGLRTLMTAHVPSVVCARGTMLRFGHEICDGRIDARQCVPCWLSDKGIPIRVAKPLGALLRRLPSSLTEVASGRVRTTLRAPRRIEHDGARLQAMAADSDAVIAVCGWLGDALSANGVARAKLRFCRQGVRDVLTADQRGPLSVQHGTPHLRVGYFGRGAWIKGLDVLVRAVCALPSSVAIELSIRAVSNSDDDRAYFARVRALASGDSRIRFLEPVPNETVQQTMREYDLVAVPSRCLETGPLVAMEALAAGIPVLGSDLGGIAELVEHGRTGWLLPPDDVDAWIAQLVSLAAPGAARLEWDPTTTRVLTVAEVAQQMLTIYRDVRA